MRINKSGLYKTLFITVLLCQIYVPVFQFNILFQLSVLVLYFALERPVISVGFLRILVPLILIFFLGFLGFLFYQNSIFQAVKDIAHFIKPVQALLIGYLFFKTINDLKALIQTVIITGLLSAVIHLFIIAFYTNFMSGSIHAFRLYTRDSFIEVFAFFFLAFYGKFFKDQIIASRIKRNTILAILIVSVVLYFSRAMFVTVLILLLSVYGYTLVTRRTVKFFLVGFLFVLLGYGYLYSIKLNKNEPGLESFLYKVKIAPSEIFKTRVSRENKSQLWDHWRAYEVKRAIALMENSPASFITGTGYGSLVNLRFKAPLSESGGGMKYISELHNGYIYILYKTGIFGLILYLFFLFKLYIKVYKRYTFQTIFISAIAIFYLFSTLIIAGVFNKKETLVFLLGALLFYNEREKYQLKEPIEGNS